MTKQLNNKRALSPKQRKGGINANKEGSVRNINGKVYVDLTYLDHRVREPAGLQYTKENASHVRDQLDRIMLAIKDGTFEFRKVFPNSKKVEFFSTLERKLLKRTRQPDEVLIKDYIWVWYELLKASDRVTERTLLGYKRQLELYIEPYFGELFFGDLNPAVTDEYTVWAKQQKYRGKPASNKTINKTLIPMKMICKQAAIKFNWGANFNPFFGFKKLPERSNTHKIEPFTLAEQQLIIEALPEHWKPFVKFAFCSGLRQGEQLALRMSDVDLNRNTIKVERALTLTEAGKVTTGDTKNTYSQRTIPLLPIMREVLEEQLAISEALQSDYLFCTPAGTQVQRDNLRGRVWTPALKQVGLPYRPMIQTRHSFATTASSLGENPLWIARTMGHSTAKMVLEVYAKYTESVDGTQDGGKLNQAYQK